MIKHKFIIVQYFCDSVYFCFTLMHDHSRIQTSGLQSVNEWYEHG